MKKEIPEIRALKDGPYAAERFSLLRGSQGEMIRISPYTHLCRCGRSADKPLCDNSHEIYGFKTGKLTGRQPDKQDIYKGKEITIRDNRGVCSHRGHCTDQLPSVFRMGVEPWIDPDGAPLEEIIRVIKMCPSGALSYETMGTAVTDWNDEPNTTLVKNGPLECQGITTFSDEEDSSPETSDHYALCRCGGSKNKPFCDGTHWNNGFTDEKDLSRPAPLSQRYMKEIHAMADNGKSINEPMGTEMPLPRWEEINIHGAQLSTLPINEDEPVDLNTVIGSKSAQPLILSMPIYITHMSFGALSREAKIALAMGSRKAGTAACSGEGGVLDEERAKAGKYIFEYVQNEYSVSDETFQSCDAVEIKIGQAVKPGIGGHFPAEKITDEIAAVRGRGKEKDIVTPAKYKDISNPEELKAKVDWLREKTGGKPIGIKLAAGNIEADMEAAVLARPDFITIDGKGGATGSVPKIIKDSASIPTLYALCRARKFLDSRNIKDISLVITGGLRVSSDFAKALALGADAVALGTAALMAIGCQQYRICNTGRCPTGITSQDPLLRARINVETASERLANYLEVVRSELETFTRMTGHSHIAQLSPADVSSSRYDIARAAGIAFSGTEQK